MLLGIDINELDSWEHQLQSSSSCWNKVIDHWLAGGGTAEYPATWEGLYTLLEDAECSQAAKDMEAAVKAATIGTKH